MTESTIRFAVEKGYFVCENEIFSIPLNPIDKLTYLALVRYCDTQQRAWPSYIRLAADVGVGKKRAIEAVKNLIDCHLLEKRIRGNRSNVYLVYPARFFCVHKKSKNGEQKIDKDGVQETPQADIEVSQEHPQGVSGTPSECSENTLRVSEEHPISTKTNNNKNTLISTVDERENFISKKQKERERDLDLVRAGIARKGYQVNNKVLSDLLSQYTVEEVMAAIDCTDFELARNPLSVIFSLLKTGRYVMQKKNNVTVYTEPEQVEEPLDRETLSKYMKQFKEKLIAEDRTLSGGAEET